MIPCLTCAEIFNLNLFKMENLFLCFHPMKCAGIAMLELSSLVLAMFFLVYAKKNDAGRWLVLTGRLVVFAMGAIIVCSIICCAMRCCHRHCADGDGCEMESSCGHEGMSGGCEMMKGCDMKGGGKCHMGGGMGQMEGEYPINDGDDIIIELVDSTGSEGDSMPVIKGTIKRDEKNEETPEN